MSAITLEAYSGDIVSRLRNWRGLHLSHSGTLFEEAAAEIEVQRACTSAARSEIARLRLTAEEREAIEDAVDGYVAWMDYSVAIDGPEAQATLATLRSLLARTQ